MVPRMVFYNNGSLGGLEQVTRLPRGGVDSRISPRPEDTARAYDQSAAGRSGSRQAPARHRARKRRRTPTLAGLVWLATGLGLCVDGLALVMAPTHPGIGLLLFWTAILLPFITCVTVLLAAHPSRALREFTVAVIGVYPTVINRMVSPLVPGGFDEHIHERTLSDLLRGSGLFAPNPVLPVSSHYAGLELFTGVTQRLTGMPVVLAMSLTVLLCRLLLVLTIYHCALTVNPSRWGASLVVILYAASPQFYFFNSQFAYQTMALTLGLGGLFLLRQAQLTEGAIARLLFGMAVLALVATVMTHHVTSWIVLCFLLAWTIVAPRGQRKFLLGATALMGIAEFLWTASIFNRLVVYLGPVIAAALQEFHLLVGGATSQRKVFGGSGGFTTPEWERLVLIYYSLACAFAALICGSVLLSRAFGQRNRMLGFLAVITLAYPVTLAAHFIPTAADLGDRASTFLFLPLALACSLAIRSSGSGRRMARRPGRGKLVFLIGLIGSIYMGGVMLGMGPDWNVLPGPYLVSAEARTQDPES